MQGVDVVIAGVGVLAVIVTTLGVVFYDEVAGVQTIEFEADSVTDHMDATAVQANQENAFDFDMPNNATGASGSVTVAFSGRSGGQASSVSVTVYFLDPTGNRTRVGQGTLNIPANSQSAETEVELDAFAWAEIPGPINTTDAAQAEATLQWDEPLQVIVELGASPAGPLNNVPQVTSYSYTAEIDLEIQTFKGKPPELPETTGGQ